MGAEGNAADDALIMLCIVTPVSGAERFPRVRILGASGLHSIFTPDSVPSSPMSNCSVPAPSPPSLSPPDSDELACDITCELTLTRHQVDTRVDFSILYGRNCDAKTP